MSFVSWFKAKVGGKPARQGTGLELARWQSAPPRKGSWELIQAYKYMPGLFLYVGKVADAVAGVCWKAYRRKDGRKESGLRYASREFRHARVKALLQAGEIETVPDAAVLSVLADPNDHFTGYVVTKLVQIYLSLVGEAFLVLDRRGKVPVGFWPVPPHWVSQLPDLNKPIGERYYLIQVAATVKRISAADVIHLRDPDPEDPLGRGIGAGFSLGDELDADEYVSRFIKNSFWNNAIPAAIVGVKGMPTGANAQMKQWHENLQREYKGPDNAGKTLVVGADSVSVARLDVPFRDMQLVELQERIRDFERYQFKIPPEVVGNTRNANRATANAASAIFAEHAVEPWVEFQRAEYQKRLVPLFPGEEDVILDFEPVVPADREHQLKVMQALPFGFSFDEWREVAGFQPDANLPGYPPLMPGQAKDPAGQTPSPEPGSPEADARRED